RQGGLGCDPGEGRPKKRVCRPLSCLMTGEQASRTSRDDQEVNSRMNGPDRLQKPVLVLNASYEPINVCAAKRALVLVLKGVASAEEVSITAGHSARHSVDRKSGV